MERRRHWGGRVAGALVTLIAGGWALIVVNVVTKGRRDEAQQPADAIVVLGAAQYDGKPSPVLRARLDHAMRVWDRRLAPLLIVTGGTGIGDTTSEAAVGRRYALGHGVPDSVIVLENHGLTTSQSMRAVAAFLKTRPGTGGVILVSDPFHMLRLSILADRLGLTPYTSPTPTSPISANRTQRWSYVLSESVKVPLAWLLGPRA